MSQRPALCELARQLALGLAIPAVLLAQGCAQAPLPAQGIDQNELRRTGDAAYRQAQFDQAQRAYKELTMVSPTSFLAWFKLGNTHLRQGQSEQAESAYVEALKIKPDDPRAWYNLATARLMNAKGALRGAAENLPMQDPARRLAVERLKVLNDLIFKALEQSSAPTGANRLVGEVEPRSTQSKEVQATKSGV